MDPPVNGPLSSGGLAPAILARVRWAGCINCPAAEDGLLIPVLELGQII